LHDSDGIPEAEVGGPDLASVSSTSRLSASLGVQEEEFTTMQKFDPAGTLRLLLSRKQSQTTTSSERTTTDSAPSNSDINSMVRQDSLLLKLTTTFVHKDVLKKIEENPACAYSHLAFLKKLHNPMTSEETLGKVIQLSSIIDQYAKAVQKKLDNDTRLATQQQAQAMFFEKAQKAQAEVDKLSSQMKEGNPGVENCDKNIAYYKQQIKLLEDQIVGYSRKIIEEETEKARIEHEAKTSTQELIDEKGREGLQAFSSAEVVAEEIKSLESSNLVVERELATLKKIYVDCTKDL
jgi:chromosome segregation ATPase